jgi:TolB-like protein/DNA-binding winged helix-turn-helix (wHTH) protein/Tfp pilus assembly protein PilF
VSELANLQESIRFGDGFQFDIQGRRLLRSGRVLKLERIPTEILLLLIEQRGQVVAREQIVERIWGKGVFLDTDNSINGAIRKIRQVLKDDSEQPRFIQTVTGQGYRFLASIQTSSDNAGIDVAPTAFPDSTQEVLPAPAEERAIRRNLILIAFATIVVLAGAVVAVQWRRTNFRPSASSGRVMLAVLPFANLTGDPAQEYFSDGMTEEMISQLGNVDPQHLGVIARTSVMYYKERPKPLDQIGRELGVQYVLEGSVRRDGNTARITAQLIKVDDQTHLWARQYDRQLNDLLALQAEVARGISEQIQIAFGNKLLPAASANHAASSATYQAYDYYLRGRYFWNKRTQDGFARAVGWFQQAVDADPNYAQAYAGLADSYALMSTYGYAPAKEYMPKARNAALRALQINDSLAEAHTSLAVIAENFDWDWQTAEKEYRRAIELNPNYATAHQWYAECLALQGRFDDALRESERARQLDPLSLIIAADNGAILYFSRQYDKAIERFRSVLDMDPMFSRAKLVIVAYTKNGQFQEALAEINAWRKTVGGDRSYIASWESYVYGSMGRPEDAQQALQRAQQLNRKEHLDSTVLMEGYAGVNDKEQWLNALEKATGDRTNLPTTFKVDPFFDPLRGDPRFQALLRQAGLSN